MSLTTLMNLNSLGADVNLPTNFTFGLQFIDSDQISKVIGATFSFVNSLAQSDGVAGAYLIVNIQNLGINNDKNVLLAAFTTFTDGIFSDDIDALTMVGMEAFDNVLNEGETLGIYFRCVQGGAPAFVNLGRLMAVIELEK